MKKLLLLFALCALAGCAKETLPTINQTDPDITRARAFVEAQAGNGQTRGVNKNHPALKAFEADWSRARVHKNKEQKLTVTEVPTALVSPYIYTVLVERSGEKTSLTQQAPHARILVYEWHGKEKSMSILLATMLPDKGWTGELNELAPRPEGSDFSGVVVYSSATGNPFGGERWDDGTATHYLFFDDGWHGEVAQDLRIAMGVAPGAMTRKLPDSDNPEWIDDVVVTPKPKTPTHFAFPDPFPPITDRGDGPTLLVDGQGGGSSGNSGSAGGAPKEYHDPTVVVPDGECLIGAVAAALQAKFGYSNALALAKATKALQDAGVNTTVTEEGGIYTEDLNAQITSTLESLGFNVLKSLGSMTSSFLTSHFGNGGFGLGHWTGDLGHMVFLSNFFSGTNSFLYYDPVLGVYKTGVPNEVMLYFN